MNSNMDYSINFNKKIAKGDSEDEDNQSPANNWLDIVCLLVCRRGDVNKLYPEVFCCQGLR